MSEVQSAEERQKKSATQRGRGKSEEHRQKIREGQQRAWARRKATLNPSDD